MPIALSFHLLVPEQIRLTNIPIQEDFFIIRITILVSFVVCQWWAPLAHNPRTKGTCLCFWFWFSLFLNPAFPNHPELFVARAFSFLRNTIHATVSATCTFPDINSFWKDNSWWGRGLESLPECFWLARVAIFEEFARHWIYHQFVVTWSFYYKLVTS